MIKRLLLFVLALGVSLLLIIMVCLSVGESSGLCFFVNRWAHSPDWSPDGERIAFTCHYPSLSQVWEDKGKWLFHWGYIPRATEICTIGADGSRLVRLTDNQVNDDFPAWSPDGRSIAFVSSSWEGDAVCVIEGDGSQLRRLSKDLNVRWEKPVWSPDGRRLYFAAGDPLEHDPGINLYSVVLESGDIHALTALPGDELEARSSPDGTQLAFVWFPKGYKGSWSENAAIRIIGAEGKSSTVVKDFADIGDLTWSPDGTRLAFWGSSVDCEYDCAEVYVTDISGDSTTCLTEQYEIAVIGQTAWSPNGGRIAFTARASEGIALYTIAPDGKKLSRITPYSMVYYGDLVWAPDGEFIASARRMEGDKLRIWIVEIEGGGLTELGIP